MILDGVLIQSIPVIASLYFCASIWHSEVRTHCKAYVLHLDLFSTQVSLPCCNYGIAPVVPLAISLLDVEENRIVDVNIPLDASCFPHCQTLGYLYHPHKDSCLHRNFLDLSHHTASCALPRLHLFQLWFVPFAAEPL